MLHAKIEAEGSYHGEYALRWQKLSLLPKPPGTITPRCCRCGTRRHRLLADFNQTQTFQCERVHPRRLQLWTIVHHHDDEGLSSGGSQCAANTEVGDLRNKVLQLADALQTAYQKIPVIYGNRSTLALLLDDRFTKYMIWFASYARGQEFGPPDLGLPGRNPWTLWQYTSSATVRGIGDNVDLSVFFGTREQFARFKRGEVNVALEAIMR
jgi:hypothetical protein